jgi:signal transduction histidine kinase
MSLPERNLAAKLASHHERTRGMGLRGQITLALLVSLGLAVMLVSFAIDRLASHALDVERERMAALASRAAAAMIARADAPPVLVDRAENALLTEHGVTGLAIADHEGRLVERRGLVDRGSMAEAPIDGGFVRVWISRANLHGEDRSSNALFRLVVLYAIVTSLGVLVLCYVLLTRLIVRPVEALTRASERLARDREKARAPVQGAAEVQRLALTFNAMVDDLRHERATLESRLRELEALTRSLRSTQDSLVRSEKLASVGRLAAGVAHEIGNPLSAILGLIELVRGSDLSEAEEAEFLGRIQRETERIHRIIRDLLDYSAAGERAETRSKEVHCDLGEVVKNAVRLVAPQKDLRRIGIEQRVPETCAPVRGESDALTQVVLNLLLNAADAIEGEGSISISLSFDDERAELIVDDTGSGIAPEVRARIFEPFVTTKPAGSGTGLGLAVCVMIVDRLGGSITTGDAPGGGARFIVRLPLADRTAMHQPAMLRR